MFDSTEAAPNKVLKVYKAALSGLGSQQASDVKPALWSKRLTPACCYAALPIFDLAEGALDTVPELYKALSISVVASQALQPSCSRNLVRAAR